MVLLGELGIDLRLLGAQIINFVVLVWLLHRLIYRPLIRRIEQDEQKIITAEHEETDIQTERTKLDTDRVQIISQAHEQARRIVIEAQEIADGMQRKS